ncbi:MAG: hypothetical protein HRT99_04375, partial [Mycoplasmatales bacterium]|nr:hypothetical protein [Mycoplasmatales bacterium]
DSGGTTPDSGGTTPDSGGTTPDSDGLRKSENSVKDNVSRAIRLTDPTNTTVFTKEQIKSTVYTNPLRNDDPKIPDADSEATEHIFNENYYAPYYDMGYSEFAFMKDNGKYLIDSLKNKGIKNIRLGFITAFNSNNIDKSDAPTYEVNQEIINLSKKHPNMTIPSIGGKYPLWFPNHLDSNNDANDASEDNLYQFLTEIRKAGLDYTFSFGGWNDNTLAVDAYLKKYKPQDLKNLYASIIDKTNLKHLDFDIEGTEDTWKEDTGLQPFKNNIQPALEVRQLRLDALKLLKMDPKYNDVRVTFTIPTDIAWINGKNNIWMIQQGLRDKIVDEIDIMTMDFWNPIEESHVFTLPGEMGLGAINAANSLKNEIKKIGLSDREAYGKIGIVPMFGINDSTWEVFDITSAILLNNWAVQNHIKSITGWSGLRESKQHLRDQKLFKDKDHTDVWKSSDLEAKKMKANSMTTGLGVSDFAFSEIFSNFDKNQMIDVSKYAKDKNFDFDKYLEKVLHEYGLRDVNSVYSWTFQMWDLFKNNHGFIPVQNVDKNTRKEMFDKEKTIWNFYIGK